MKKNVKKILSAILALVLALQVYMPFNVTSHAAEAEARTTIQCEKGVKYVYYTDISQYRTEGAYTYEKEEGYVFAGWWTGVKEEDNGASAEPWSSNSADGAWAKYLPEEVLTVKAQVSEKVSDVLLADGTASPSNKEHGVKLRLVTSVDERENYDTIGFKITIGEKTVDCVVNNKFYDELTVYEKENSDTVSPAEIFHEAANVFAAFVISGFDTAAEINDKELKVTPYWETKDGTLVEGTTRERLLVSDERAVDSDGSEEFSVNSTTYTYSSKGTSTTTAYKFFEGASDTVYLKGQYTPSSDKNVKFGIAIRNGGETRQVLFSNVGVLVTNGDIATSGLVSGEANAYKNVTGADGVFVWARKVGDTTDSAISDLLAGTTAKTVVWAIENNVLYCSIEDETVLRIPMEKLCAKWQDGRYYQLGVAANGGDSVSSMTFALQENLTFGKEVYKNKKLTAQTVSMTTSGTIAYEPIHGSYKPATATGLSYAYGDAYKGATAQVMSTEIQLSAEGTVTSSNGLYLKGGAMITQIAIHGTGDKMTIRFDNGATNIEVKDWVTRAIGETAYYTDGVCKLTAAIKDETLFIFINEKLAGSVDLYKVLSKSGVGIYIEGATLVALGVCAVDANGGQSNFKNVTYLKGDSATTEINRLMTDVTDEHEWEIFTNNGVIDGTGNDSNRQTVDGYAHTFTVKDTSNTNRANNQIWGVLTTLPQKVTATYSCENGGSTDGVASPNGIIIRKGGTGDPYFYYIDGYSNEIKRAKGFGLGSQTTLYQIPADKPVYNADKTYNLTAVVKNGTVYIKYNDDVMIKDSLPADWSGALLGVGVFTKSIKNDKTSWTKIHFEAGEDVAFFQPLETIVGMTYDGLNDVYTPDNTSGLKRAYGKEVVGTQVLSTMVQLPEGTSTMTSRSGFYIKSGDVFTQFLIEGIDGNKIILKNSNDDKSYIFIQDWIKEAGITKFYLDGIPTGWNVGAQAEIYANGVCKLTAAVKDDTLYIFINDTLAGSVDLYKLLSNYSAGDYYINGTSGVAIGIAAANPNAGKTTFHNLSVKTGEEAEKIITALLTDVTDEREWEIFTDNYSYFSNTGAGLTVDEVNGYLHTATINETTPANNATYGVATTMPQRVTATYSFGDELTGNAEATASSGNGIIVRSSNYTYIYGINGYGNTFERVTNFNWQNDDTTANRKTWTIDGQAHTDGIYNVTAVVKDGWVYFEYNDEVVFRDQISGWKQGDWVRVGIYTRSQANVPTEWSNISFEAGKDIDVGIEHVVTNLSNMTYDKESNAFVPDSVDGLAYAYGDAYVGTTAQVLSTEIQLPTEGTVTSSNGLYLKGGAMITQIAIHGTGDKMTIRFDNGATNIEVKDWVTRAIGETAYYTDGVCKLTAAIKDETLFIFINEKLAGSVDLYKVLSKSGVGIYIEGATLVALGVCAVDANGGQSNFKNVTYLKGDSATTEINRLMADVTDEHEWEIFTNNGAINGTGNATTNNGYVHTVTVNQTSAANCHTYGVTTRMPQKVTATYSFGELTGNADATTKSGNGIIVRWGSNTYIYGINGYGTTIERVTGFNWQNDDNTAKRVIWKIDGQAHTDGVYNFTAVVKDGVVYIKYNDTVMFKDDLTSLGLTGSSEVKLGVYTRSQANVPTLWTDVRFEAGPDVKVPSTTTAIVAGKRISILGDSISTYAGISNNGNANSSTAVNAVYYPTSHPAGYPVAQNETYWGRIIEKYDMSLIVNNSASGSLVTARVDDKRPSGLERCEQLHNNAGTTPEIIVVYMGTNDLTKGKTVDEFTEAYTTMLSKIKIKYSAADVFCFTLLPSTVNAGKDTELNAYNAQIRTIAAANGCTVVDIAAGSGITRQNTADYMDGSHPHAAGHAMLANTFEEALMLKYATYQTF